MAVMGFDDRSREMFLQGCYPGVTPQQVLDSMSFEVDISRARPIAPPSQQELQILRKVCDPQRLILD